MRVNPNQPCEVCRGTGKSYLEHPDGSLTEIECRYCHGSKDSTWVEDRFWAREHTEQRIKVGICVYLFLLVVTNGWPTWSLAGDGPSGMFALHCLAWFVGIGGLVWWFVTPKAKKAKTKAPRHAPGFTEPQEKLLGAAVVGGALLKAKWDQSHKDPRA